MQMTARSMSPLPAPDVREQTESARLAEAVFPVETEIYILPDGSVVIADLPIELARPFSQLGSRLSCEISDHDILDSAT